MPTTWHLVCSFLPAGRLQLLGRRGLPQPDGGVAATCGQDAPIARHGRRQNPVLVSVKAKARLAGGNVPTAHGHGVGSCNQPPIVGGKDQGIDPKLLFEVQDWFPVARVPYP